MLFGTLNVLSSSALQQRGLNFDNDFNFDAGPLEGLKIIYVTKSMSLDCLGIFVSKS
jgi:hypothetical protein